MDGRDVTTGNSLDIAEILNDLYAREISGSIAWIRDRGFRARLEKSKPVENWFRSSGDAARWLSRQALVLDPQGEFTQAPNQVASDIAIILNDLYTNRISGSISWIWDRGFYATLGAPKQADDWAFPSINDAVEWLIERAVAHYQDSEFARSRELSCAKRRRPRAISCAASTLRLHGAHASPSNHPRSRFRRRCRTPRERGSSGLPARTRKSAACGLS